MSEIPTPPGELVSFPSAGERPRPRLWQVGLRTLGMLLAVVAVWLTAIVNRRQSALLETRISVMQPLAHELKIDDPSQYAAVKLDQLWRDENRWDLYLPAGEYRVSVATREVDKQGMPSVKKSAALKGGKHRLGMEFSRQGEGWRFRLSSDGNDLLTFEETRDWGASGSSSDGEAYSQSTQLPTDRPLELYRRRYMVSNGNGSSSEPTGPADGILLWIEPVIGPKPTP